MISEKRQKFPLLARAALAICDELGLVGLRAKPGVREPCIWRAFRFGYVWGSVKYSVFGRANHVTKYYYLAFSDERQ